MMNMRPVQLLRFFLCACFGLGCASVSQADTLGFGHERIQGMEFDSAPALSVRAMDNDTLQHSAAVQRAGINRTQADLNQQWLRQHQEGAKMEFNGNALAELVRNGVKRYWGDVREDTFDNSQLLPDERGDGQLGHNLNYDLSVGGDELSVGVNYRF